MKILFAGTTAQAAQVLRHLATRFEVVSVLTREDAPFGRKGELKPSPVALVAEEIGLATIKANRVDARVDSLIARTGAELGIVVAYGALLKRNTLDVLSHGWFNLHYSLLPAYRGAAPVQHALLNGETSTGVTIFKLDEGMDTGEIYLQVPTAIEPDENAANLLERLTSIGISALDELLPALQAGTAPSQAQVGDASIAGKLNRGHARLDFSLSAKQLENRVRAFNPEPMAWSELSGQPLRIIEARVSQHLLNEAPGTVKLLGQSVLVACSDGALELLSVQPAGKPAMPAGDWLRGQREAVVLS